MQLVRHIPDDLLEPVKDKSPPPDVGVLESVALDAILGFLHRLADPDTHWPNAMLHSDRTKRPPSPPA
jgi:hypothetical protein